MNKRTVGTRVVAVRDAKDEAVYLYGRGKYVGDWQGGPTGSIPNPLIELDSAEVVWGCECWWMSEEEYENKFRKGRPEVIVPAPVRNINMSGVVS